jgi:probable F420-dependent oxidoreductase
VKISIVAPQVGVLARPDLVVEVAQLAERLGYDGIWVLDRILFPLDPSEAYPASADGVLPVQFRRVLDPLATLSFLAAHTSSVSLGTSVLAVPCYHPVVLARELATIDQFSGGRLKVGLGGGWSHDEFRAVGAPDDHRGARLDEFVEALVTAWTAEVVDFDGRFEHIPPSRIDLEPVQRPHPPLYLAAFAPASMLRVARYANGWNPAGIPIPLIAPMFRTIRRMAADAGRNPEAIELVVRGNIGLTDTRLGDDRPSFVGDFDQLIEDVRRCEDIGADEVILDAQFSSPGASAAAYTEFIEELATHLLVATAPR